MRSGEWPYSLHHSPNHIRFFYRLKLIEELLIAYGFWKTNVPNPGWAKLLISGAYPGEAMTSFV